MKEINGKEKSKREIEADKRRILSLMQRLKIKGLPVIVYKNDQQFDLSNEKSNNVLIIDAVREGDLVKDGGWYRRMNKGLKPSAIYEFKRLDNTVWLIHKRKDRNEYKFVFISDKHAKKYMDLLINGRVY
jgi:hypothetical protein